MRYENTEKGYNSKMAYQIIIYLDLIMLNTFTHVRILLNLKALEIYAKIFQLTYSIFSNSSHVFPIKNPYISPMQKEDLVK